jgi:hypothetical protein
MLHKLYIKRNKETNVGLKRREMVERNLKSRGKKEEQYKEVNGGFIYLTMFPLQ